MTSLNPESFNLVKNYIHDKGDSVTIAISSRTDKFDDITYHFVTRNGLEIRIDNAHRIYFLKDNLPLGNILFLPDKNVETEIPESKKKKENEKIVLHEFELLLQEAGKHKK